ncbi:uncharacterized protein LOC126883757 [Diabrotica virgifera virgifera]|uniref:Peptidase aspartic putative domain-containing protein n=1 Tax=Diabrotica virgifera virgifera TaxID=50390 RepID=A0ABM5K5C2_DIAVI|nr:uncharacterized protein LOC126883757 [Diabrotica virgifera virgifera]
MAWDLLKERYDQKRLLIHSHIRELFEYPVIQKDCHASLRSFYDTYTKNLRALQVLDEKVGSWDSLLLYLFTNKLDKYTRRELEQYKIQGDLPTMTDFNKFLKQRCEVLEKLEISNAVHDNTKEKDQFKSFNNKFNNKRNSFVSTYQAGSGTVTCYFCKGKHTIFRCEKLLNLTPAMRLPEIRKLNLYKNCLRPNHEISDCRHSGCKACGGRHNSLLHVDNFRDTRASSDNTRENNNSIQSRDNSRTSNNDNRAIQNTSENQNNTQVESSHTCFSEKSMTSQVLLSTALVNIQDRQGKVHECRALLDNGSQSNFITRRFCEKLNISIEPVNFKIVGVGQAISKLNNRVKLHNISSCTSDFNSVIDCLVLENITDRLPTTSFNKNILKIPKDIKLADDTYNRAREIDLLIGSSVFWKILQLDRIQLEDSKVVLQETKLGWILGGAISSTSSQVERYANNFSSELNQEQAVDKILLKFWEIEDVHSSVKTFLSEEDQYYETYFKDTLKRADDNKFIVSIPFKENLADLGDSLKSDLKRYFSQESRLLKNPELKRDYDRFMQEYLVVEDEGEQQLAYYMPHHAILWIQGGSGTCTRNIAS